MRTQSVIAALLSILVSCSMSGKQVHVSTKGDDLASGSMLHPVRTLNEALRRAAANGTQTTILLGEGTWHIQSAIGLDAGHSGVRIIGRGMGRTVISGGVDLPAFRVAEKRDSLEIWSVDLSDTFPGEIDFQQLYVNGERADLARTPDKYSCYPTLPVTERIEDGIGYSEMQLDPIVTKALSRTGSASSRMRIYIMHKWNETIRDIDSISMDGTRLFFHGKPQQPWNHVDDCSQFFLENDIAFLDRSGEWFHDRATNTLYYIPEPGQTPEETTASVPVTRQLLVARGEEGRHLSDVIIKGITFQQTSFPMGAGGWDPQQSGGDSDAAVEISFTDDLTMEDCEITGTGNNGIWIMEACRDCEVLGCRIHDLGIGGIKVGSMKKPENEELLLTRRIKVDNCIFQGGSRVLATGAGILLFNASDCTITHNDISDFSYTGISVGWSWGYAHSPCKRNDISYNHIHHLGWGVLSDMGGIYTLGPSEGTKVTHNVIHHIYSLGYGGWGIYPDEGSTGVVAEYNLVHDCKSAGFHLHYGKDNVVRNNLFVNQINEQLAATRVEEHMSFKFESNVVAYSEGEMYSHNWPDMNSEVRNNLYWKMGGDVDFNGKGIEEWKGLTGKDEGSIVADPGFRDIAGGDYTMTNEDALERIGFKQFDWKEAGVYGSARWKRSAMLDRSRTEAYSATVRRLRDQDILQP